MRKLGVVLAFILALPVSWFLGALVANPFLDPVFKPVDLEDPPIDLALLAGWTGVDGHTRCRIFYRRDIGRHEDSLPQLRFGLSDADMAVCSTSLEAFRRDGRWPDQFSWDASIFAADASRQDAEDQQLFEVLYMSDVDRLAETRYKVDPTIGQPTAFEFRGSFGPAQGIGLLMYGVGGGTIFWLTLLMWYVNHRRIRRATPGAEAASDQV
jgi:hypothetical protein